MACPSCGGSVRAAVAPGYWECQSIIYFESMHPDPVYGTTMVPFTDSRICGVRYAEGGSPTSSSAEACQCGTYAIGRCMACKKPVCGDHSLLDAGSRRCSTCVSKRLANDRAHEKQQAAARAADDAQEIRAFLTAASSHGYPGAVDVFATAPAMTERDKKALAKAAEADYEKRAFGINGSAIDTRFQSRSTAKRLKKIAARAGTGDVLREISRRNGEKPVAKGWLVHSFRVGIREYGRGSSEELLHHKYLLTDGRLVDVDDSSGLPRLVDASRTKAGSLPSLSVVRQLAAKIGVSPTST